MPQDLFYIGLNSHRGHKGVFFVLVRPEFLDFSAIYSRNWKFEAEREEYYCNKV